MMSDSQFNSLLDFGDPVTSGNGTTQNSGAFDPFDASPTIDVKGSTGGDLLADFTFDSQVSVQKNGTHNDTDLLGINTSNNVNPLYELSNSSPKESSAPVNPLYSMEEEYSTEPQKQEVTASASGNPLYDFMSNEETNGHQDNSMDLMGTSATISSDDSGVTMETGITMEAGITGEYSTVNDEEESGVSNEIAENMSNEEQEDEAEMVSEANGVHVNDQAESDQPGEVTLSDEKGEVNQDDLVHGEGTNNVTDSVSDVQDGQSDQQEESAEKEVSSQEPFVDELEHEGVSGAVKEPPREEILLEEEIPQQEESAQQEEEEELQQEEVDGNEDQVGEDQADEEVEKSKEQAPEVELTEPIQTEQESEKEPEPEPSQVQEEAHVSEQEEVTHEQEQNEFEPQPLSQEPEIQQYQPEPESVCQEPQAQYYEPVPEHTNPEPEVQQFEPEHEPQNEPDEEPMAEESAPGDVEAVQKEYTEEEEEQVTFRSTSFICLSPGSPLSLGSPPDSSDEQPKEKPQPVVTPKKEQPPAPVQTQQSSVVQNGLDSNTAKETKDKEEIRFDEMSSIKNKFESGKGGMVTSKVNVQEEILSVQGGEYENQPETFEQWQNTTEGGVYENQPQENPDVFKEDRRVHGEELPEEGMAKNILNKFRQIQEEDRTYKRELTPPDRAGKSEFVSEPRTVFEMPKEKVEAGVFESQPEEVEDVVRSADAVEEVLPEKGYAQNVLAKFKQYESEAGNRPPPSPGMRELTPDRNTRGEYVSEPRTVLEQYEGKVESGTFESQPEEAEDIVKSGEAVEEMLPEKGTALSMVSKFREYESQSSSPSTPRTKKELTPDRYTKGEYVSEPRGFVETYEGKSEAGVFESQPHEQPDVVKSGEEAPEALPEAGYAKNLAAKFREIEKSGGSSPTGTPQRLKEVTPPRDLGKGTVAGVVENTPQDRPDVVKSSDARIFEEELPERGMAKNILNRFKEIQTSQSPTSPRQKKEFTPPPDKGSGVYESTPSKSLEIEVVQAESGILESTPTQREDVARESQYSEGDTLFPESGFAKNMVNKWKQIESESGKGTPSPKYKEFTPPREDPRSPGRNVMSPKSPAGVDSSVQPNDLPGQYHEQVSAGVYENNPEYREDIYREADTDYSEGLPAKDTTKALLQRFKSIQEEAKEAEKTPEPISRKETTITSKSPTKDTQKMLDRAAENDSDNLGVQNVTPSKRSSFIPKLEKCEACQKAVYAMEKLEYEKSIFHRSCFKCYKCNARLTPKTFSVNSGTLYCTTHYKQLFTRKGNYDEGFGRQQHKKKWGEEQDGQSHVANGN